MSVVNVIFPIACDVYSIKEETKIFHFSCATLYARTKKTIVKEREFYK